MAQYTTKEAAEHHGNKDAIRVSPHAGPQVPDPNAGLWPAAACIHENFQIQAARTPDSPAITFGGLTLSYSELNGRANRLAHKVRELGAGPEVPVALYLDRSVDMVVAILAVLKAGSPYVPIDLAYPRERMAFMLEDTRAPIVLTQASLAGALPESPAKVLCVDGFERDSAAYPAEDLPSLVSGENAAYIIYTSGSTGKPKGVIVTHSNVVRLFGSTQHWFCFGPSDVWALFHSYSFDMSVWELWGSLFYGGRLVVVPYAVSRSPQDFLALLSRERVTFLNQTPSAFRQVIWADASSPEPLPLFLRCVTCGGEALEVQSLKPWFDRHGDQKPVIVNMYGITETTVHSTYRPIRRSDLDNGAGSVFGVPIPDLRIYLVDEQLKPVPPLVPGEICVGGAGVTRGYLNRPELSAQRFIPDPFEGGEARMYRSGDLAQVNAFGEMEYLGRMDHQVKIRGFRVELGEIESALNRHPCIRESVVLARGETGDKRLVAYFVPRESPPSTSDLRAFLTPMLPDYMVPGTFVQMHAFPLTNNGKIDRRALPEPQSSRPALSTPFIEPSTQAERIMAAVWQEVLGVAPIGVNDNFFELGGDSLRAILLISNAAARGLGYSIEDLFDEPTVARLVQRPVRKADESSPWELEPFCLCSSRDRASMPDDIEDAYPIAALQLGMFFHNELNPVSAMYHDVFSFEVGGPFDAEKLGQSAQMLVDRHPMLRTSFHLAGFDDPLQLVHTRVVAPYAHEDDRALSASDRRSAILDWIEQEKRRPFDRTQAPLMRFHAKRQTDCSFQLFVSFHHSCTDGWSLAALVTELLQDYCSLLAGATPATPKPGSTYRDFIALELQSLRSETARSFWANHLATSAQQTLPRWPAMTRGSGHEQIRGPEVQVSPQTLEGLKRLAQRAEAPLKTVLLAAHMRVMSLLFGHTDIVTGLVSNGRPEHPDGNRLIGLFLNTVPVRQQLKAGSWTDLVGQAFAAEKAVMPHRRFPLAEVQSLHGRPLLETAFDFVHFHVYNDLRSCGNLRFSEGPYFEANNLATYTTFILDPASSRLEFHIDYDPNQIAAKQIEEFNSYYLRTLEAMACDPGGLWAEFSPMPDEAARRILVDWNSTAETYPEGARIEELFELQALKTPNATAVQCGNSVLSYSDLNARANEVAGALAGLVVEGETPVGLCIDRSPAMLVGLLGILKAGAAYVPLDPAFPSERLEFICKDAGVSYIVAENATLNALPATGSRLLNLDSLPAERKQVQQRSGARRLAYVIYTSGSTGKPKGTQIEHRSVVNLLLSAARRLRVSSHDRLLAITTLSFDIAGLELLMPLLCGGAVLIADRATTTDGSALCKLLTVAKPTLMQGTPSTWRMLIEAGWKHSPQLRAICGGEALPTSLAEDLLGRCGEVWNFYGPTETTIWSTAEKVDGTEPISIGRPLANTEVYILDSQKRPVPPGVIGELLIGGHGLARGYWGREELTHEKFVPHPFRAAERIYRTGDLARFLPDGRIECLGRIDHQVKIRGYRIEPGEIETALSQHSTVLQAIVMAREDRFGEKRLTAYVVPKNGHIPLKEIRAFLAGKLPAYMVPAHFILLKSLPLTPNGKIDSARLPSSEDASESTTAFVPPSSETEENLAAIWQEVLGVRRIGVEDNFFDLGADSLSATRAFARINANLTLCVTLREIFENPTVRQLAELASRSRTADSDAPIKRQPRRKDATALAG